MTTQAETFNTADSDTLGPVLAWTEESGDIDIVSNRARIIAKGDGHPRARAPALSTDDQLVKAVVRTSNNSTTEGLGVMMRKNSSSATKTYYHFDLYPTEGTRVWRCVTGTFTSLGSSVATTVNNNTDYTITAFTRDSTHVIYVDNTQKFTITDSNITGNLHTGIVGAVDEASVTANQEFDSFNAQDLPITFVNAGAEGDAGSGNVTLGAPASPQNNDVWIAVVHSSDQVSHSFTDWTQIVQGNGGGTTSRLSVWYHRYAGSTPNLVVTHTAGAGISGGIAAFRGCKTSGSPVNVSSSITGGTDASIEHATVTPTVDGCLLLVCNGSADDNSRTTPAGYAVAFTHVGTLGNPDESSSMMYRDVLNGVATGTITITQSAADAWASVLIALEPATGAYEINAEPGSYSLSGVAATIVAGRMINAESGSYSLTGFAATLSRGFMINAEPGSYSISGLSAGLIADRMINAQPGSYVVNGVAASIVADRMINAESGTYLITGVNASVVAGRVLAADPGAYAIVGVDAALVHVSVGNYSLNAEPGVYGITGFQAGVIADRILNAESGGYSLTGAPAGVVADRMINAESGAYTLTGLAATLEFVGTGVVIVGVPTGIPNVLADGTGRLMVTTSISGVAVPCGIPGVLADNSNGALLVTFSPVAPLHPCGIPNVLRDSNGAICVTTSPTGDLRPTGIPGVFADSTGAIYIERVSSTADVGTGIPNVYATATGRLRST